MDGADANQNDWELVQFIGELGSFLHVLYWRWAWRHWPGCQSETSAGADELMRVHGISVPSFLLDAVHYPFHVERAYRETRRTNYNDLAYGSMGGDEGQDRFLRLFVERHGRSALDQDPTYFLSVMAPACAILWIRHRHQCTLARAETLFHAEGPGKERGADEEGGPSAAAAAAAARNEERKQLAARMDERALQVIRRTLGDKYDQRVRQAGSGDEREDDDDDEDSDSPLAVCTADDVSQYAGIIGQRGQTDDDGECENEFIDDLVQSIYGRMSSDERRALWKL